MDTFKAIDYLDRAKEALNREDQNSLISIESELYLNHRNPLGNEIRSYIEQSRFILQRKDDVEKRLRGRCM